MKCSKDFLRDSDPDSVSALLSVSDQDSERWQTEKL
jgi:hypothetical protein